MNYVEPFAGSLAVLLNRPHTPRTETVNDLDCYLANFWRALQTDPEGLCSHCDWPVNEADLHARHTWLLNQVEFRERMKTDPDYFEVKIAGWWVWGLCQWIGGNWCNPTLADGRNRRPSLMGGGQGVHSKHQLPRLGTGNRGVHRKGKNHQPRQIPQIASNNGVHTKRPEIRPGGRGITREGNGELLGYLEALAARLRRVRVCCGDFARILGPAATTTIGLTGVLLDPPYSAEAGRDKKIYSTDDLQVAHRAREWALEHGDDPKLRIALCGYDSEHVIPDSWECVKWQASGGTSRNDNHKRERIWFSPHCLTPRDGLFGGGQ